MVCPCLVHACLSLLDCREKLPECTENLSICLRPPRTLSSQASKPKGQGRRQAYMLTTFPTIDFVSVPE
eukprot:2417729-Amphidinium_carterae.1